MRDEWSGLADLLANLIAKYASQINTDGVELPVEMENFSENRKTGKRAVQRKQSMENQLELESA